MSAYGALPVSLARASLIPGPGDEGEAGAAVQRTLQFGKVGIDGGENADVHMDAVAGHLDRYGMLEMILKLAVVTQFLALLHGITRLLVESRLKITRSVYSIVPKREGIDQNEMDCGTWQSRHPICQNPA